MTFADDLKAIFVADTTLAGPLTGGIYTYEETKRYGISIENTPLAYDTNGILKPTLLVKDRSQTPDYGIMTDTDQLISTRHICEIWLYDDGDSNGTILEAARKRVFTLIAGKRVSANKNLCRLLGYPQLAGRDSALGMSLYCRSDYVIFSMEP